MQNVRAGIGTGKGNGVDVPVGVHVGRVPLRFGYRAKDEIGAAIVRWGTIWTPVIRPAPFYVPRAAAVDPKLSA